jgi:hypothetical protein
VLVGRAPEGVSVGGGVLELKDINQRDEYALHLPTYPPSQYGVPTYFRDEDHLEQQQTQM